MPTWVRVSSPRGRSTQVLQQERVHLVGPLEGRRGGAEHEPIEPFGLLARHPHRHHPAERDTAERYAPQLEAVEEREEVAAEVGHRVGAGWNRRLAVAAVVVAEDAEALC